MGQRRPKGPSRPSRPRSFGASATVHMSRVHGQELRTDRPALSFHSKVSRQQYWANRIAEVRVDDEDTFSQDVAALDHTELKDLTQFESANISTATLDGPNANNGPVEPGNPLAIPGLDQSGAVIPPPPK